MKALVQRGARRARRKLALQPARQVRASHTRKRSIFEGGAGSEQTWERVSGRRTVVRWMLIERRREASEKEVVFHTFSEVRQQVLASLFGQPTQGHEEV